MYTIVVHENFGVTASCLDPDLLDKQCRWAWKILSQLIFQYDDATHPAIESWRGYELGLVVYGLYLGDAVMAHGDNKIHYKRFQDVYKRIRGIKARMAEFPPWTKDPAVHLAFKEILLARSPEWYGPFFPDVDEPFVQPEIPWELIRGE